MLESHDLPTSCSETVLSHALHVVISLLNTTTNSTPDDLFHSFDRSSSNGDSHLHTLPNLDFKGWFPLGVDCRRGAKYSLFLYLVLCAERARSANKIRTFSLKRKERNDNRIEH